MGGLNQSWFMRFFKGIIIALGFILPGVSGGVLAAILGLYERMLRFLANIRENFKENFLFFLPVGIGGLVGIGLLSAPLEYLLEHHNIVVLWAFSGAIIGTPPSLIKESASRHRRDLVDFLWFFSALIGGFLFLYHLSDIFGVISAGFFSFIIAGALIALGILVPGLSPSNFILYMGLYEPMLEGFRTFDLPGTFLPIAIGGLVAMLLFSKLMETLITHFHSRVYHFIIGLVFSSTALILLPPVANYEGATTLTYLFGGLFFLVGVFLGGWMSNLEDKYK